MTGNGPPGDDESRPGPGGGDLVDVQQRPSQCTPRRRRPAVRTVLVVDLSKLVEGPSGELGIAAEDELWRVLGNVPSGRNVRLLVGEGRWVTLRLIALLEQHLADASSVVVEGTRPVLVDYIAGLLDGSTTELAS